MFPLCLHRVHFHTSMFVDPIFTFVCICIYGPYIVQSTSTSPPFIPKCMQSARAISVDCCPHLWRDTGVTGMKFVYWRACANLPMSRSYLGFWHKTRYVCSIDRQVMTVRYLGFMQSKFRSSTYRAIRDKTQRSRVLFI